MLCVNHRVGGLEAKGQPISGALSVNHRVGGLEVYWVSIIRMSVMNQRVGSLEEHGTMFAVCPGMNYRAGGIEKVILSGLRSFYKSIRIPVIPYPMLQFSRMERSFINW